MLQSRFRMTCCLFDGRDEKHGFVWALRNDVENWYVSAYAPDLPGCVATGFTVEETEREMREAIEFHIEGLIEDGLPIPRPASIVEYLEIAA